MDERGSASLRNCLEFLFSLPLPRNVFSSGLFLLILGFDFLSHEEYWKIIMLCFLFRQQINQNGPVHLGEIFFFLLLLPGGLVTFMGSVQEGAGPTDETPLQS